MSSYLQIEGDPTEWWPAQAFEASQLTGQPLSIPVLGPLQGTLVLSGKAANVAVFDSSAQPGPTIESQVPSVYVPTAAGLSAGHTGYELANNVNLTDLANQIIAAMQSGHGQTIALNGGGALVLNGATLPFVVLCQQAPPMVGAPAPVLGTSVPHDSGIK
jgi:hypothetical protein